jgi:hypothetical protein
LRYTLFWRRCREVHWYHECLYGGVHVACHSRWLCMDHLMNKAIKFSLLPFRFNWDAGFDLSCYLYLAISMLGVGPSEEKSKEGLMVAPWSSQVMQHGLSVLTSGLQPLFCKCSTLGQDSELRKCSVSSNTEWICVTNHINPQWWKLFLTGWTWTTHSHFWLPSKTFLEEIDVIQVL